MYSKLFSTLNEQAGAAINPLQSFNRMMVNSVEELTKLQLDIAKNYSELSIEQLKQASEVNDMQSWVSFNTKQAEVLTNVSKSVVEDGKRLTALGQNMKGQLDEMTAETIKKATPGK